MPVARSLPQRMLRTGLLAGLVLILPLANGVLANGVLAGAPNVSASATGTAPVEKILPHTFRGDVRTLPHVPSKVTPEFALTEPRSTRRAPSGLATPRVVVAAAPMPGPIRSFAGLSQNNTCSGVPCGDLGPPDANGDVGPSNYIEAVNSSYAIYSKTGTLQASFTENSLWSSTGVNPCNGNSFGDPSVLYDTLADRWILSNLAFAASTGPFYQCIAASMTADPVSGGWWLYTVRTDLGTAGKPPIGTLNDYGKFGLWTDCLYFGANGFAMPAGTFSGAEFASFSRSDMYAGLPLTWALGFIANTTDPFTMIPSNLRAASAGALPPSATPNYFVSESTSTWAFEVRKFTAGTNCGAGWSLSAATNVSQTPFTLPGPDSVPQPNTAIGLDPLPDRLMQKVQYRRVGSTESLWVVHTVQTPSASTVSPQWAQIDVTGGTVATTPVQQQIFAPDSTLNRWMGSLAADKDGNVALGYSTSNGSSPNFPSIAYAGRLATDPLGTLPQTEVQLAAGAGSQTNACGGVACHRWGDYTGMSVDPVDDCTFWYVNEYYSSQANGTAGNWQTRIGSFKFPSCISTAAASTLVVAGLASPRTAGAAGSIRVTAKDGAGNTVTGYRGTIHFTSTDTQAVLPANYAFVAGDAGTHLFAGVILKSAGTRTVSATDTVTGTITGSQTGIIVNADLTSPTLTSRSPAPNATGVGMSPTVTVRFSEPITGLGSGTMILSMPVKYVALAAKLTYDPATLTATLRPTLPLLPGTTYRLAMSGSIRDLAGNSLAWTWWLFKTTSSETYTPARSVLFAAGTYIGYRFSSTGAVLAHKAYTLATGSSAPTTRRASIANQTGAWYYVTAGVWAGYWIRDGVGITLR